MKVLSTGQTFLQVKKLLLIPIAWSLDSDATT